MPRTLPAHPTAEQLRAFGLGQLSPGESAEVERHVESCGECCQALQAVPDDTVLVKLKQSHTVSEASAAADSQPMLDRSSGNGAIPPALRDHPRYRVLKQLGRGGMGVVYKAEHRLMERPVALKVISRRLISNRSAVERFQREVKLAARLTHPNIVVAHDAEQAGDLHFLVMEFVDGISLAQFVERKGPLPVPLASLLIRQAALGLQAAAQHGMVHRDIKPQNLMLTRKGQIKILDFGLARFASEGGPELVAGASLLDRSDGLTSAGTILGTPDYMAPEQAEDSSQADIRADIYSLGCTFFFLLTGEAPFAGDSVTRTLQSHVDRKPPALRSVRPDLPPELVRIVERMMAKDPAARFQKPNEVANALTTFATGGIASMQQWEAITVTRPVPRHNLATEIEEPPTTIELVRRRHWKTLWNRGRYETRKFFRLPHRRAAAGVITVLLVIATTAFLADRFGQQLSSTTISPPRETEPPRKPSPPRPQSTADNSVSFQPTATRPATSSVPSALLRNPRVALVVTHTEFLPDDYPAMRRALEARGMLVTAVSSREGWATPKGSSPGGQNDVWADLSIEDVRPGDFDAIVFLPSGRGEFLSKQPLGNTVRRFIQEQYDQGVCMAAVGNGVLVLADHGFLKGQHATIQSGTLKEPYFQDLGIFGVNWEPELHVVSSGRDGLLVTARSFGDAELLAKRLLATITKKSNR